LSQADFTWIDGERLIRFGRGVLAEAPDLLEQRGFSEYALLTTDRAAAAAPNVAERAATVLRVPSGSVPEAAATVRDQVGGRPVVALGGGRVIDSAKAIGAADGLRVAALPSTLSGAELTAFHRMPAGVEHAVPVRPALVVADPELMASQPMPQLAASAVNALAHAIEALYAPVANPAAELVGLRAAELIAAGLGSTEPDRDQLALGALLAAWAAGSAGFSFIHVVCQTIVRVAGTPHAATYAVMLPHGLRVVQTRRPDVLARVAVALGAAEAASRAAELAAQAQTTRLSALGVGEEQVASIVDAVMQRPDLAAMPDAPGRDEIEALLRVAL
jgi:alcohol dehydrogenase class IV